MKISKNPNPHIYKTKKRVMSIDDLLIFVCFVRTLRVEAETSFLVVAPDMSIVWAIQLAQ